MSAGGFDVDVLIAGGGIVGLAVARACALAGREVVVVERHRRVATEVTARNSGVIHSGLYYPAGSLKALCCVRGRELLYAHCEAHRVPHARCGKLIVAQADQLPALQALLAKGRQNGVTDLEWLDRAAVHALEPAVHCAAALWSPSTGIVDVPALVQSLVADLESRGGSAVCATEVLGLARVADGWRVDVASGGVTDTVRCRAVVNSAGLSAVDFQRRIAGYPAVRLRKAWYCKGSYFALRSVRPFRHLVYPLPDEAGLGVHATLALDGTTRFGPDVEWIDDPAAGYDVDAGRAEAFRAAIGEYWPPAASMAADALVPDHAGIRPKLVGPGSPAADFVIEGPADHGLPGLVNLLGIESPGLTASLALGERVAALI